MKSMNNRQNKMPQFRSQTKKQRREKKNVKGIYKVLARGGR